jgi:hypothetical protein
MRGPWSQRYNSALHTIEWVFSGIGVLGLMLIGRFCLLLWTKRSSVATTPTAPAVKEQFTKPTPDEMTRHIESLPPFQREMAWDAYTDLEVCWQAVFRSIDEDPENVSNPTAKKKWVVDLKFFDPSVGYSPASICCPGVDIEEYPQFKSLHKNELLIVRGRVDAARLYWVLLKPANFEFCGKRIE